MRKRRDTPEYGLLEWQGSSARSSARAPISVTDVRVPGSRSAPLLRALRAMILAIGAALLLAAAPAGSQIPDAIAAPGETQVAQFHAKGAQIYQCKADPSGALVWQFREPIATLLNDGQTVGRHYAGPSWELNDGSAVVGKVAASAPGATSADIALLRLDVTARRGNGRLSDVTTVQRVNTHGGGASGACPTAGAFLSVAYSADYVFLRKG